jgi:hypothetical protein
MGAKFKNNWVLIFGNVLDWNIPEDYSRVSVALSDWSQFFRNLDWRAGACRTYGGKEAGTRLGDPTIIVISAGLALAPASIAAFRVDRKHDLNPRNPHLRGSYSQKQTGY